MMGHTHAAIGLATGLAISQAIPGSNPLLLGACAGLAALLPDIDHPAAPLRQKLGTIGDILFFWLPHRGLSHTMIAAALVFIVSGIGAVYGLYTSPVWFAISGGYVSHLIADSMTVSGVKLLWPLVDEEIHLPPQLRTGGAIEQLIFVGAMGFIGWLYRDALPIFDNVDGVLNALLRSIGL